MTDDLLKRLLQPPFGTETSERNLMAEAAVRILELEAASARARDDALVEAAREVTKALAMQDAGYHVQLATLMQAIQDLRTQPPPSVEPVTVQVAAGQSAEQRAAKLLLEACEEASPLDDLIQTAMDRAAFTDGTSEWVFNFRAALRAIAGEKP